MPTGCEILDALYKIVDELDEDGDTDADVLRKYVGQVADQFFPVDCTKCIYGAEDTHGGIVCVNYGSEEHRPMGYCQCFESGQFDSCQHGFVISCPEGCN